VALTLGPSLLGRGMPSVKARLSLGKTFPTLAGGLGGGKWW